jgi:bacterioferritin
MGTQARKIVGMDVKKLLNLLSKALADEWLAYYQYWVGSKIASGIIRDEVIEEFSEHAEEELKHANMLTERIIQLGGSPISEPSLWYKLKNCDYEKPTDPSVKALLVQNIRSEQCAIRIYHDLLKVTKETDPITYQIVLDILSDEVSHEEDLETLFKDLKK